MAFNIPDTYADKTPAAQLDKKTLNKMVWRSLFLQASFNYERMQAAGWLYSILPGLEKIHKDKKDLAASMSHNMEFFNSHPFLINLVMGIVLSLEQNKSDIPTIRAVRVAAMGPLGGIGDALFWLTLVPIAAGITSNMAIDGNIAAPFLFLIIFNAVQFGVRFFLMHWSYKLGTASIGILTANAKAFTRAASIMGIFVVGALTCTMGGTKLGVQIDNGTTHEAVPLTVTVPNDDVEQFKTEVTDDEGQVVQEAAADDAIVDLGNVSQVTVNRIETKPVTIDIQAILDGILPCIIPLALTFFLYLLLSKFKFTPLKCILVVLVIGLVGAGFGLWPSIWG